MAQSSFFILNIMIWTSIKRLADAVFNDVVSGLRGYHQNMSMSKEQLEEEIVQMRLAVIKEYMLKGILPIDDLLMSINCIPVDCNTLDKCSCGGISCGEPTAHFQIPQLLFDFGLGKSIKYLGSTDRTSSFLIYTKLNIYQNYRKRGKNKPWVYIDITPNQEGLLDCYIFGAPFIKQVSITAIFKDPRQLEEFQCDCQSEDMDNKVTQMDNNLNFLDIAIKERLTKQKLYYYRQLAAPLQPNDQEYKAG